MSRTKAKDGSRLNETPGLAAVLGESPVPVSKDIERGYRDFVLRESGEHGFQSAKAHRFTGGREKCDASYFLISKRKLRFLYVNKGTALVLVLP